MNTKTALVTGGAGFIGSTLTRQLLQQGWSVVVYDNLVVGQLANLPADHPQLTFVQGNILDQAHLTAVMEQYRPAFVYHLAALHFIPYCNQHPAETLRVNVEGTANVLEVCRLYPLQHFVFTSTAAVYPAVNDPIDEQTTVLPMDVYGRSKQFGEELVKAFQRETHTPCTITRLFNVYGPRETNPHLIPVVAQQLVNNSTTLKLGNLEPKRDYVFVEDVARVLYQLSQLDPEQGWRCVNVATGREYSVLEIVATLQKLTRSTSVIEQDPGRMRPSDRPHLCGNVQQLHTILGWYPSTPLDKGLHEVLNWTERSLN